MKVRSRRKQERLERIYITAGLFLGLIVLGVLLPRTVSMLTDVVLRPVHSINLWINESEQVLPQYIRSRRELDARIEELETQLARHASMAAGRQYLIEENDRLRMLFALDTPERIAAAVVARPTELPYDVVQVDAGARAGVEIGSPVFINKYIVIGVVSHVTPDYSLVTLISAPEFETTAFIGGPNVIAPLVGQGGGIARVRVPQGIELKVGNTISLPAVNPQVLGRVEVVENVPTQPEQYGYVSLPIALQQLHTVAIGSPTEYITDPEAIAAAISESLTTPLRFTGLATSTFSISTSTSTSTSTGLESETATNTTP